MTTQPTTTTYTDYGNSFQKFFGECTFSETTCPPNSGENVNEIHACLTRNLYSFIAKSINGIDHHYSCHYKHNLTCDVCQKKTVKYSRTSSDRSGTVMKHS